MAQNATFNLFFLGLGWPWVGEFDGFTIVFILFPTQQKLVNRKHPNRRPRFDPLTDRAPYSKNSIQRPKKALTRQTDINLCLLLHEAAFLFWNRSARTRDEQKRAQNANSTQAPSASSPAEEAAYSCCQHATTLCARPKIARSQAGSQL